MPRFGRGLCQCSFACAQTVPEGGFHLPRRTRLRDAQAQSSSTLTRAPCIPCEMLFHSAMLHFIMKTQPCRKPRQSSALPPKGARDEASQEPGRYSCPQMDPPCPSALRSHLKAPFRQKPPVPPSKAKPPRWRGGCSLYSSSKAPV